LSQQFERAGGGPPIAAESGKPVSIENDHLGQGRVVAHQVRNLRLDKPVNLRPGIARPQLHEYGDGVDDVPDR